ncbi:MAG: TIGR04086 family membrane protein [Lachnospiraceae bacterium]|nr:TIGR04086 family membrane protein [Lachnospiraceae bacterium]
MRTIKYLTRSLFFSYLLSALLLTALAFGLFQLKLAPSRVAAGVYGIYAVSCFLGGLLAGKGLKSRKFFWGLLIGLLYFLLLALMSFLFNKGLRNDTAALTRVLGICAVSGTVGGMIS